MRNSLGIVKSGRWGIFRILILFDAVGVLDYVDAKHEPAEERKNGRHEPDKQTVRARGQYFPIAGFIHRLDMYELSALEFVGDRLIPICMLVVVIEESSRTNGADTLSNVLIS